VRARVSERVEVTAGIRDVHACALDIEDTHLAGRHVPGFTDSDRHLHVLLARTVVHQVAETYGTTMRPPVEGPTACA
jgi:hypothetical protein